MFLPLKWRKALSYGQVLDTQVLNVPQTIWCKESIVPTRERIYYDTISDILNICCKQDPPMRHPSLLKMTTTSTPLCCQIGRQDITAKALCVVENDLSLSSGGITAQDVLAEWIGFVKSFHVFHQATTPLTTKASSKSQNVIE